MVQIQITRKKNNIVAVTLNGHSDYAEYGNDIVCAAVSALFISTFNGLERVAGINGITGSAKSGDAKLRVPNNLDQKDREKADLLLETLILALEDIKESYPEDLNIHYKQE